MKKYKLFVFISLIALFIVSFASPSKIIADSSQSENKVGIYFDNDYPLINNKPNKPTDSKNILFPQMGEYVRNGISYIGIISFFIAAYFCYKKIKLLKESKN